MDRILREIKEHFGELINEDAAVTLAEYRLGKRGIRRVQGYFAYSDGEMTVVVRGSPEVYRGFVSAKCGQLVELFIQNDLIIDYVPKNEFRDIFTPLCDLSVNRYHCVRGLVSGIGGIKVVKNGRKIALLRITDKECFATVVLWDDKVDYYKKVDIGDEIRLYNVFANEFNGEINVHVGRRSFVELRNS